MVSRKMQKDTEKKKSKVDVLMFLRKSDRQGNKLLRRKRSKNIVSESRNYSNISNSKETCFIFRERGNFRFSVLESEHLCRHRLLILTLAL